MWRLIWWLFIGDPVVSGKMIYETGKPPSGRVIEAFLPSAGITVDAAVLPCASCHGRDGKGRPEGGLEPPDLRWRVLAKTYGHRHANGRRHSAFDPRTFGRALTMGLDPSGNILTDNMPRYRFTREELDALTVYVQGLGEKADPGVHDSVLRVGAILPNGDAEAETIYHVVADHIARINDKGGLFRRKLVVVGLKIDQDEGLYGWQDPVRDADLFALIGPPARGKEREIAELAARLKIPIIAPLIDAFPKESHLPLVFYLHDGSMTLQPEEHADIAMRLFIHALRQCGRDLNREGLVKALEATYRFPNGALPPLSYGPHRRIGVVNHDRKNSSPEQM